MWNALYLWITFWTAKAQIETVENLDFWVLLFGRIGSWFLLVGLPMEIGATAYVWCSEYLVMNGWLWIYIPFVIKMLGFCGWATSVLATLTPRGAQCLSDERGGLKAGEKYDEAPFI